MLSMFFLRQLPRDKQLILFFRLDYYPPRIFAILNMPIELRPHATDLRSHLDRAGISIGPWCRILRGVHDMTLSRCVCVVHSVPGAVFLGGFGRGMAAVWDEGNSGKELAVLDWMWTSELGLWPLNAEMVTGASMIAHRVNVTIRMSDPGTWRRPTHICLDLLRSSVETKVMVHCLSYVSLRRLPKEYHDKFAELLRHETALHLFYQHSPWNNLCLLMKLFRV